MTSNTKINIVITVSCLAIILLFALDLGRPDIVTETTFNPLETDWDVKNLNIKSYIQTILSALLGFLLSILVIESVINKTREQEENEKKVNKLLSIISTLSLPIAEYSRAAIAISSKNEDIFDETSKRKVGRKRFLAVPISTDKLFDIFNATGYIEFGVKKTKIEYYYQTATELQSAIKLVLLNADLSGNPKEAELFKNYLSNIHYDILHINRFLIEPDFYKNEQKILKEAFEEDNREDIPTNMAYYPYVALKRLINYHDKFFHDFLGEEQYNDFFCLTYKI